MAKCHFCGGEFSPDELGAHLLSVHTASTPSCLGTASEDLKGVIKSLKSMGGRKFVFAHLDNVLGVAEVLSVALEELERLEAEVMGINETLGEHLGDEE